jgi:hypothetical protein
MTEADLMRLLGVDPGANMHGENVAELPLCVLCGRRCRYAREYCSTCRRAVTEP